MSLSDFKKQNLNQQHRQSVIQPMTELYLREFFANYFLDADKKQIKNMYVTSLQVLNAWLRNMNKKQANYPKELGFEQFYDRLKTIFSLIQQKLLRNQQNNPNYKENEWFSSDNSPLFSQKQTISYGSQDHTLKIYRRSQNYTDDELYQLVVQLKQQNHRKTERIHNLEKQMLQKVSQLQLQGQKYKQQSKKTKDKDQVISKAVLKQVKLTNQKIQLQGDIKQLKQKCEQISNINTCITQQNESKYKQIQRLTIFQALSLKNIEEYNILNCKLADYEQNLKIIEDKLKISVQNQRILAEKLEAIQTDNMRLKSMILNKLRFLNTAHPSQIIKDKKIKGSQNSSHAQTSHKTQNCHKEKKSKTINTELQSIKERGTQSEKENIGVNSQTHSNDSMFIKRLIQERISNRNLINSIVETQLGKLVSNLTKTQQKYQKSYNPISVKNDSEFKQNDNEI